MDQTCRRRRALTLNVSAPRKRQGQRFYTPGKRPRGWSRVDQGRPTEVGPQRRELCPHSKCQPTADAPRTPANGLPELGRRPGHLLTSWPPEPRPRSALCLFASTAGLGPSPRKPPFPEPATKAPPSGQREPFLPTRCRGPVAPLQTPSQPSGQPRPPGPPRLPTQPRAWEPPVWAQRLSGQDWAWPWHQKWGRPSLGLT